MDWQHWAGRLLSVVFEDAHFLAVNKPAGLAVVTPGGTSGPGLDPLVSVHGGATFGVVRPLEQHTSGILLLPKSREAAHKLTTALDESPARTEYLAVTRGQLKKRRSSPAPVRKGSPVDWDGQVMRRRGELSLVRFRHEGRRTSAVRADLQSMGLVTLGDVAKKPGATRRRPGGRMFLHRAQVRFRHPFTGKTVTISATVPPVFNAALGQTDLIDDTLHVALVSRLPLLLSGRTDAYRLFTGQPEGVPGLVVEQFGPVLILQIHEGKFHGPTDRVRRIARWYSRLLDVPAVYGKRFVRNRSGAEADPARHYDPNPLLGESCPAEILIDENGLRLAVRPYDGFSTGLFLDGRDTRRRVRELAAGGRVLNAFAYTCGFSVAAAIGQAAQTVSVDISAKALEWGRRNFEINHLPLDDHQFIRSEQFEYFNRARRQGRTFDLIVLDPPSFARTKRPKTLFSVVTDLQRLVTEALTVLAPGGSVLLSTNNRTRTVSWLSGQIAEAAAAAKRRFRVVDTPPLPLDFAADRDYAKTIIARFP
ncbi:MAG: class I SAM-dependent methyltransferase [Planctomycetes bacterium]|nr:class I SAM-dependent methyltransferase [Planctomycetota bacterium]